MMKGNEKRVRHKYILAIFIMVVSTFLGGCDREKNVTESTQSLDVEESIQEEEASMSQEETLDFVDAIGEWHEMVINPNVRKHAYNWGNLTSENLDVQYDDGYFYTRKGIDVSHHQGKIDWNKVKQAGYEFAIVRVVYRGYGKTGSLNLDRTCLENIKQAQSAGFDVGVYVFSQAINEKEALQEAELVIQTLQGLELELPVVFDPELIRDDDARTDNVSGEQFTKNTIVFCERIKEAGYEPMVYSNLIWESELFDMEQIQRYPIWYADYEKIPQTPYDFEFWQYSEKGIVDGVEGIVDLNVQFCRK